MYEKKLTKKEIYAKYGIAYDTKTQRIETPYGWKKPLLVDGNAKIGKGVYHFSTLPGTQIFHIVINGMGYDVKGTCKCDCVGCYAKTGNYRYQSVKNSLGMKTLLIREHLDFVKRAIMAQIDANDIKTVRIHASGDFDSAEYVAMWIDIVKSFPAVTFWTYTKVKSAENAFDSFQNANIVKSVIDGIGVNYGHIDYIESAYNKLSAENKTVHICRCGIDKNQHCTNCKGCATNDYVLFVEHSTEYKAEKENGWQAFKAFVESLKKA